MTNFDVTVRGDNTVIVTANLRYADEADHLIRAIPIAKAALPLKSDPEYAQFAGAMRDANRKIEAIKLARALAGLGLKEAKDLVEAIHAGQAPMPTSSEMRAMQLRPAA